MGSKPKKKAGARKRRQSSPADEAARLLRQAEARFADEDLEGAAGLAREALGRDGKAARARGLLGLVEARCERWTQAARQLALAKRGGDRSARTMRALGHTMNALERPVEAAEAFGLQAEVAPEDVDAWFNHAGALMRAGENEAAVGPLRRLLELDPDDALACGNLGAVLRDLGQVQAAVDELRRGLERNPDHTALLQNLGNALHELKEEEEATALYERLVQLRPNDANAWHGLASSLRPLARSDEALAAARRAAELAPLDATYANGLARALCDAGQAREAIPEARRACALEPGVARYKATLGSALLRADDAHAARAVLEEAVALDDTAADTHSDLGTALITCGQIDAGCREHQRAIELEPNQALSWFALARAGRVEEAAPIERAAKSGDLHARATAHYALGEVYQRAARYEESFRAYEAANALRAELAPPFDERDVEAYADQVIAAFPAERFADLDTNQPAGREVLVVGMPRSGTTLVERILGAHAAGAPMGERADLGNLALSLPGASVAARSAAFDPQAAAELARAYRACLGELGEGVLRTVDKWPVNFWYLGFAALAFPGLRIVHTRRDPRDTCVSCWTQNFRHDVLSFSLDLRSVGAYHRACDRVMAHWAEVLPHLVHRVDYEALVEDQEGETRKLIDHVGLPWDPNCLEYHRERGEVYTASVYQVRKPVYKSSVGRWRRFEPWLGPLFEALEPGRGR